MINEKLLKELLVALVNATNLFTGKDKIGERVKVNDFVDKIFEKEEVKEEKS